MEKQTVTAEPRDEFPRSKQSASGVSSAFSVEARYTTRGHRKVGDQVFTDEWQKINFDNHPLGVPTSRRFDFAVPYFGLMSYQAAQALRWWFHAALDVDHHDMCMETRIVEHQVKYSLEECAIAAHEIMGCSDGLDRSVWTSMPKKEKPDAA